MKFKLFLLSLLVINSCFAQKTIAITSTNISDSVFNNCSSNQPTLVKEIDTEDTLIIDNISYKLLGTFKNTNLYLLQSCTNKAYSIIDYKTGRMENLLSFPVFSADLSLIASFGTIHRQELVIIYKQTKSGLDKFCMISSRSKIIQINCLSETSILAKEIDNVYTQYNLEIKKSK